MNIIVKYMCIYTQMYIYIYILRKTPTDVVLPHLALAPRPQSPTPNVPA